MNYMNRGCISLISCLMFFLGATLYPANIIFDLGGVLIMPNKSAVAMKAGPLSLGLYAISHMENPRKAFFNILDDIEPYTNTEIKAYDENGVEIPGIMCDWLKGIPSTKILGKIEDEMTSRHALWPLAKAIFEPKAMASAQLIIKKGQKFVQECIEQGHYVYILSNWDPESFTYLQQQYPEFFSLFSGIVISGDCGLLKPDPAIFKHLLREFKLDPKNCFFIDNQQENITAALTVGISGSLVDAKPDFNKIREDLSAWLINNSRKQEIGLILASANHSRLGQNSPMALLSQDLLQYIMHLST